MCSGEHRVLCRHAQSWCRLFADRCWWALATTLTDAAHTTVYQCSNVMCDAACRVHGESHVELSCNEVYGEEKDRVAQKLASAARSWWQSLLAEPHSFEKLTFQLGLDSFTVTNILPDGATERTPGRVELLPNGAAGFSRIGDRMCFSLNVSPGRSHAWCVQAGSANCLMQQQGGGRA